MSNKFIFNITVQDGGTNINHVDVYNAAEQRENHLDLRRKALNQIEGPQAIEEVASTEENNEELFHFVHPCVSETEEWQVHNEVKRLVRSFGIQEICLYLSDMKAKSKVLLPQNMKVAYDELVRMGLPSEKEGFAQKTFEKYYKR